MSEVVRHLVHEPGFPGAVDPRALEVMLAQLARGRRVDLFENSWITRIVEIGLATAELVHDLLEFGSSCVPSTCEWDARICSSRVDPERGNPTTKMGSGSGAPKPRRRAKKSAVQTSICRRVLFSMMSARYLLSARLSALPLSYQRNASAKSARSSQALPSAKQR